MQCCWLNHNIQVAHRNGGRVVTGDTGTEGIAVALGVLTIVVAVVSAGKEIDLVR